MSVGYLGKTTNLAREAVATQAQAEREAQMGEIPGRIVFFNAAKQTATIQPLYKPVHDGQPVDMPELLDVPVRFARAGKGGLTFPVGAGDTVSLRPQMRSSENYHSGDDYTPSDTRSLSLSDMEAYLDGGEPLTDPIKAFDANNTHLRFDENGQFGLRGSRDGKVALEGAQGDIYDLLARVVELLSTDGLDVKYGSSQGTSHALEHRASYLEIANKLRAMALKGGS